MLNIEPSAWVGAERVHGFSIRVSIELSTTSLSAMSTLFCHGPVLVYGFNIAVVPFVFIWLRNLKDPTFSRVEVEVMVEAVEGTKGQREMKKANEDEDGVGGDARNSLQEVFS